MTAEAAPRKKGKGKSRRSWFRYRIRDPLEAAPAYLVTSLARLLPVTVASAIGGWIGRTILSRVPALRRRVLDNLSIAMPELDETQRLRILRGCLDHYARAAMEAPHWPGIVRSRFEVVGIDIMHRYREAGQAAFYPSAHFGGWELGHACLGLNGLSAAAFYRRANNRFADRLLTRLRLRASPGLVLLPKGEKTLALFRRSIKEGRAFFVLLDQRATDGPVIPFFGHPVPFDGQIAELSLRFRLPFCMARVERLPGLRFRLVVGPEITIERTGDIDRDTEALMTRYVEEIEAWIREQPEQWLWLHRRWRGARKPIRGGPA